MPITNCTWIQTPMPKVQLASNSCNHPVTCQSGGRLAGVVS
jgi:hypothetical protein